MPKNHTKIGLIESFNFRIGFGFIRDIETNKEYSVRSNAFVSTNGAPLSKCIYNGKVVEFVATGTRVTRVTDVKQAMKKNRFKIGSIESFDFEIGFGFIRDTETFKEYSVRSNAFITANGAQLSDSIYTGKVVEFVTNGTRVLRVTDFDDKPISSVTLLEKVISLFQHKMVAQSST